MSDILMFGNKNEISIEIEVTNWAKKRGKCRLWVEGKPIGEF